MILKGFIFLINIVFVYSTEFDKELIKDFLESKQISCVNLLVCWSVKELVQNVIYFNSFGIKAKKCSARCNCFTGNEFNVGFVLEANCSKYSNALYEASISHKFTENQYWLILNNEPINQTYWSALTLGADSELTYVDKHRHTSTSDNQTNSLVLSEIYNTGYENKGVLITNDVGTWSRNDGIVKYSMISKISQRSNLRSLVVRSSAIVVNKFKKQTVMTYLMKDKGDTDIITKAHMFVTQYIGLMFNMRFTYRRITRWGERDPVSGMFDGQTGQLQTAQIDVGGSNQYLKASRLAAAAYIGKSHSIRSKCLLGTLHYRSKELQEHGNIGSVGSIIVFKQPTSVSDSTAAFLKPLAWSVWYMTTGLTVMFIVLLLLTYLVEHYLLFNRETFQLNKIWYSLLMIIAMLCQQGNGEKSIVFSIRIIMFCCVMFSFLLFQFYSASIVSFLLSEPPRLIKTPQDLIESDLGLHIHDILYHKVLFETTRVESVRRLYEVKCDNGTRKGTYVSMEEGMEQVFKHGSALYGDSNDMYTYLRHKYPTQTCQLDELDIVPQQFVYLTTRKGFPLKNIITVGLRRLEERSLMVKEYSLWTVKRPECHGSHGAQPVPVGLAETRAAFQLLLWGLLLSLAILLLEILYERRWSRPFPFVL